MRIEVVLPCHAPKEMRATLAARDLRVVMTDVISSWGE
jgi:hypothetical protein